MDRQPQATRAAALAVRTATWLRDEEAAPPGRARMFSSTVIADHRSPLPVVPARRRGANAAVPSSVSGVQQKSAAAAPDCSDPVWPTADY
jgi:hypothetical protein